MPIPFQTFLASLEAEAPPPGLTPIQEALWHDARGDWDRAHELVQDLETREAAHIHAYLHRKEGDQWNADYWYRRAGASRPGLSLEEEWKKLAERYSAG